MEISRRSVTKNENPEKKNGNGVCDVFIEKCEKKAEGRKTRFFLIVFKILIVFFSLASDGLVGLSFYSRPFFPGKGGFLWILKPLPNKKTEVVVKVPCLGYV